jgi:hypothetical protein
MQLSDGGKWRKIGSFSTIREFQQFFLDAYQARLKRNAVGKGSVNCGQIKSIYLFYG